MMYISFYIKNDFIDSRLLKYVPRLNEAVWLRGIKYSVVEVAHLIDHDGIRIQLQRN